MDIPAMPHVLKASGQMTKSTLSLGRPFRPGSAGFSVVGLVILVAVISILPSMGFPLYLSYSRAQETDGAARTIVVSMNQARQLAVMRGTSFSVETQTNPNNRM